MSSDTGLMFNNLEELQRHLNALKSFMLVNLDETNRIVFNTTEEWVSRSKPECLLGEEKVPYIRSFIYVGVSFTQPYFSLQEAACVLFSCGNAALDDFERQCHANFCLHGRNLRTKPS